MIYSTFRENTLPEIFIALCEAKENGLIMGTSDRFAFLGNEVSGGTDIGFKCGYCPFTPERVCRVDPVGGYYEENVKCQKCYWREG